MLQSCFPEINRLSFYYYSGKLSLSIILKSGVYMKKITIITALFISFVLFFSMKITADAKQDPPLIEVTSEKAVVYDNRTGALIKVGELLKGEVYRIIRPYGENWYEIVFSDRTGYVPRISAIEVTGVPLKNEKKNEGLTGDSIKTNADITVYDNSTGSLIPFAIISKDINFPILGVNGNWYKIEVAGRIGFVYKTNVTFHSKPIITPPSLKGKVFEITADKTEVFDNRSGKLVKVGELYKGQVFKMIRLYGENWIEIQYSDRTAYIARVKAKEANGSQIVNENKYYTPLGDLIKLSGDTTVFDNSTGSLIPFANVSKNTIYPILSRYGNWYKIDVGGRIGFIHKNNAVLLTQKMKTTNAAKVPVLMYHHLLQKKENIFPNNNVILNVENFKEQLNYLSKNGFQTVSLSDLEAYLRGEIKLKEKTILLTFDDGHKTNHLYALPLLKQYGYQAGAFIITGRITNTPSTFNPVGLQSLSVPEINAMKSHFQIGSHTANMHSLSKNKSYVLVKKPSEVLNDFVISKKFLNTTYFCYPFGQYTNETINLLKKAGYTSAYTTKTGYATTHTNRFEIPRFGIYPYTSIQEFIKIVNGQK